MLGKTLLIAFRYSKFVNRLDLVLLIGAQVHKQNRLRTERNHPQGWKNWLDVLAGRGFCGDKYR
jgi:hypothetical protein